MSKKFTQQEAKESFDKAVKMDRWIIQLKYNQIAELQKVAQTEEVTHKIAVLTATIAKLEERLNRFIAKEQEFVGA